jgi:hypothetical protein
MSDFANIPFGPREIIASFLPSSERYPDVYGEEYVNEEADKMLNNEFPECINLGYGWKFYEYISSLYKDFLQKDCNIIDYTLMNPKQEHICITRSMVKNNNNIYMDFIKNRINKHDTYKDEKKKTKNYINIMYGYEMIHDILDKSRWQTYRNVFRNKTIEIINDDYIEKNEKYKIKIMELYDKIFKSSI